LSSCNHGRFTLSKLETFVAQLLELAGVVVSADASAPAGCADVFVGGGVVEGEIVWVGGVVWCNGEDPPSDTEGGAPLYGEEYFLR
jgi:hypothetical protein